MSCKLSGALLICSAAVAVASCSNDKKLAANDVTRYETAYHHAESMDEAEAEMPASPATAAPDPKYSRDPALTPPTPAKRPGRNLETH